MVLMLSVLSSSYPHQHKSNQRRDVTQGSSLTQQQQDNIHVHAKHFQVNSVKFSVLQDECSLWGIDEDANNPLNRYMMVNNLTMPTNSNTQDWYNFLSGLSCVNDQLVKSIEDNNDMVDYCYKSNSEGWTIIRNLQRSTRSLLLQLGEDPVQCLLFNDTGLFKGETFSRYDQATALANRLLIVSTNVMQAFTNKDKDHS